MGQLFSDVRLALRTLFRERGYTLTLVATFGLCVGANVAIFAVVKAVLLAPLPFPEPHRLAILYNSYPKAGAERAGTSVPHFLERRENLKSLSGLVAYRGRDAIVGETGQTERIAGLRVSPDFFDVLGVRPMLGRGFRAEEGEEGKDSVVILSHGVWQQRFAGDPAAVGRALRVDGVPLTVIGVMPPAFRLEPTSEARLWTPLAFRADDRKPDRRHSNNLNVVARLAPGATVAQLQSEVDALNAKTLETDPYQKPVVDAGFHTVAHGLQADLTRNVRSALWLLQGGAGFVLLIGAVNLANLILVRSTARAKEMAVRRVLGAGALPIARHALVENGLLATAGGLLGVAIGAALLPALRPLGLDQLPRGAEATVDPVVALAAVAIAILTGAILALPPIVQHLGAGLGAALSVESRGGTTSRRQHRIREALIVAQIALAAALLTGAILLTVSFGRVLKVDPGFRPDHLLTARISLPRPRYQPFEERRAYVQRLLAEVNAIPGVQRAAIVTGGPFSGDTDANVMTPEGHQTAPGESLQAPFTAAVAGDFFGAYGIALKDGRLLRPEDGDAEAMVAVIDERYARRYWPNESPVGRRIRNGTGNEPDSQTFTIVGVAASVKQNDLTEPVNVGAVYMPYRHGAAAGFVVAVRTDLAPAALGAALQTAAARVDPEVPVFDVKSMDERLNTSLGARRTPMVLAGAFAAAALLLSAVGIYGVLAYTVTQRRREIGIRLALGALPAEVHAMFLRFGARMLLFGLLIAAPLVWWVAGALRRQLFGVEAMNPWIMAAAAGFVALAAFAASFIPARRAAQTPAMEALRAE